MVPALLGLFSVTSKNFSIPWGLGKPVKNRERVSFQAPTFKVSAFIRCLNFLVQFASVVVCTILFVVKILALGSNPNRYESIYCSMHRRRNCQFSVRWIHYSRWSKLTSKSHLCAMVILWHFFCFTLGLKFFLRKRSLLLRTWISTKHIFNFRTVRERT